MSDKSEISVKRVFELMDQWRHLPDYQLERRADIFFALFLPEVLKEHLDLDRPPVLIPEFPIKKCENNRSIKVDYLALQRPRDGKRKKAFLVELKTDMSSIGEAQKCRLKRTAKRELKCLVADVVTIALHSKAKSKYAHLLHRLGELELVNYGEEQSYEDVFGNKSAHDALERIRPSSWVCDDKPQLEVLYVQPRYVEDACIRVIDFWTFADIVERGKGGKFFRLVFANYLRKWALTEAGSSSPLSSRS